MLHSIVSATSSGYPSEWHADYGALMPSHEATSVSEADAYNHSPALQTADLAFRPWLLEVPTALPRSSSFSGSESLSTPPYIDHTTMYHQTSQPQLLPRNFVSRDPSYIDDFQHNWPQQFAGADALAQQQPLPVWVRSSYGSQSLPFMDNYGRPYQTNAMSPFVQSSLVGSTVRRASDSALFRSWDTESSSSNGSDSDSDNSGSEHDGSRDTGRESSCSTSNSKDEGPPRGVVLKLGKWPNRANLITTPEQRLYACPIPIGNKADGHVCGTRFARPEHLRRHVNSVHSVEKLYGCKVPSCCRFFSRGDNLRYHYWTHLERGGRSGTNEKMQLEQLKAILGPKEKKLIKKLKLTLIEHQRKMRARAKL